VKRAALLVPVAALLAGCSVGGGTTTVTSTQTVTVTRTVTTTAPSGTTTSSTKPAAGPCAAGSLQGSFDGIPGSAGAGQTSYRLTLTNTGATSCWVQGLPQVQLLGTTGGANPTNVTAAPPVQASPPKVSLAHGASATADARFSPDVAGTGDVNKPGAPCEATSTVLRVTAPGGGTLDAPIQPPTPVCERGSLRFTAFVAASP
jgi:Domain of unknown function (DUF4232)